MSEETKTVNTAHTSAKANKVQLLIFVEIR